MPGRTAFDVERGAVDAAQDSRLQHMIRRAGPCDPAAMHRRNAVRQRPGETQIVQYDQHAATPTRLAPHDRAHLDLVFQVEAGGGLVEQEIAGRVRVRAAELGQRARQVGAVPLAAGKVICPFVGGLKQSDVSKHFPGDGLCVDRRYGTRDGQTGELTCREGGGQQG